MVDPDGNPCNIREKNSAIQKPKQKLQVVKPNGSAQSDSRTTPPDEITSEKFDKERNAQLEKPNKVAVCSKRRLAGQKDVSRNGSLEFRVYLCLEKLTMDLCSLRSSSSCRRLQWKSNLKPPRGESKSDISEKQTPRSSGLY
ncbi:uncharacterized protein LOC104427442 [Eucalyptus grandis]|uniref:uncharacterized protein LOC104427442 n=1 Tax=Eucalyptus grandis TaxID=71139 RepID=UPI00192F052A|nr:uncharacterized protein LOC104427442 [Eucalyptus grandis]